MGRRQPCRKRRRLQVSSSRLELEVPTGGEVDDGEKEESIRKNVQAGGLKQLDSSHLSKLTSATMKKIRKHQHVPKRGIKRPHNADSEDEEEDEGYEAQLRLPQWTDRKNDTENDEEILHYRLPLKDKKGLIQQEPVVLEELQSNKAQVNKDEEEEEEEEKEKEWEMAVSLDAGVPPVLSVAQLLAVRERKLMERKHLIAELASRLVEDPEENIELLKKLRLLCSERDSQVALRVRKLAMVSLMTVFKDIVPSYCIRELTAAEKSVKVSKDVRKLRDFEQILLSNYQHFLTLLEDTVQVGLGESTSNKKVKSLMCLQDNHTISDTGAQRVAEIALKCQIELAHALSHFNFRKNIFTVLVQRMNSSHLEGKVSQMCCNAVSKIFQNDLVGDISLELLQLITKMLKSRGFNVKPEVLRTFLHLQLHSAEGPTEGNQGNKKESKMTNKQRKRLERQRMSRKERKRSKIQAQVDRELLEVAAEETKQKKSRLQTEAIKLVFYVYFRILKMLQCSPLLGAVLEGLAKFAHLISVDYFNDLISILHTLIKTNHLSHRESMQCVLTAFEILSGQGECLNIDPREFFCQLYSNLLQLDFSMASEDVQLILQSLERMTRKRREISSHRVLAFVKRLTTMSMQVPPGLALAVMAVLRQFMQMYPHHCDQLVEADESTPGAMFRPDIADPELSGAHSTLLWELSSLCRHFDPHVSGYAKHLLAGAPSQGKGALHADFSRRSPEELYTTFSWPNTDIFTHVPALLPSKMKSAAHTTWIDSKFAAHVLRVEQQFGTAALTNTVIPT